MPYKTTSYKNELTTYTNLTQYLFKSTTCCSYYNKQWNWIFSVHIRSGPIGRHAHCYYVQHVNCRWNIN